MLQPIDFDELSDEEQTLFWSKWGEWDNLKAHFCLLVNSNHIEIRFERKGYNNTREKNLTAQGWERVRESTIPEPSKEIVNRVNEVNELAKRYAEEQLSATNQTKESRYEQRKRWSE
jgi:hypothetical protein